MLYVSLSILVVLNAVWLAMVLFGIPGNWLMILSTCLLAWWTWDQAVFSGWTLIAITALALAGELVEFLAGMLGARGSGASWRASVAAVFGAILGALFGTFMIPVLLLGTVLGASVGAGLAVWAIEVSRGERAEHSLRRGVGAGIGQFVGITSKIILGLIIWVIIAVAAFWP
ncbi:MAG: DUF456 domain-containing protein [Sedimentisphaerales bacterium]|nr:DUF456 domain-containing protein [Sedimentisphaerales bacterium]